MRIVLNIADARPSVALALTFGATLMGCATALPSVRSTGLTLSLEGVHLAVVGLECDQAGGSGAPGTYLIDATVAIEVGNPTASAVVVHPDRFLLIPSDGSAVRTSLTGSPETVSVDSGVTVKLSLPFKVSRVTCLHEMRLEPNSALELRGRPVNIGPVRFTSTATP